MKNNFYKPLLKHKFVVYGGDHANPLGMVRSLGEMGIAVDVVDVYKRQLLRLMLFLTNSQVCMEYRTVMRWH